MIEPTDLRAHYRAFLSERRILLTGHSHQAWPDVAREGLLESFEIAARHVDDKWTAVFAAQDELRVHIAKRIGCFANELAFAPNTHELVKRFLSAVSLAKRPHVVTTDGEFHAAFRQLRRLSEEGVRVTFVPAEPVSTLAERVAAATGEHTAAVVLSTVLFGTASIVPSLDAVMEKAARTGTEVLLDAYHAFDIVPFTVPERAFLVAGGYKYAQWGEGLCFLRVPKDCVLRPIDTGWFAGFGELAHARDGGPVGYAADGATRFAGSTFDPASTFRARAVARFFDAHGLTPEALRAVSLKQTARIVRGATPSLPIASPAEPSARGGFVTFRTRHATALVQALRERRVFSDARGDLLRLGPAPYVTDDEIDEALEVLASATEKLV